MLPGQFVQGCMDHSQLGSISVGDGHLPAVLDKICNGLCGFGNRCLLFRKIGSQGVVAQGQYKSLFCHMDQFLSLDCSISPIISHFFGGWKEIFAILPQVCYDDGRYGKI